MEAASHGRTPASHATQQPHRVTGHLPYTQHSTTLAQPQVQRHLRQTRGLAAPDKTHLRYRGTFPGPMDTYIYISKPCLCIGTCDKKLTYTYIYIEGMWYYISMSDTNTHTQTHTRMIHYLSSSHARTLEALPVYNGGSGLVILTFGNTHLLDVPGDDKIDPPIQAEYLHSGGAPTSTCPVLTLGLQKHFLCTMVGPD
jgi:hypothetical protein